MPLNLLICLVQGDQKVSLDQKLQYCTADSVKMAIIEYIRNVDCAMLNTFFENTDRRVNKCLETGG
jgi:hypothetical protein